MAERPIVRGKIEWNDEIERKFNEIFDSLDKDGNDHLDFREVKAKELARVTQLMGYNPTDTEIRKYIDSMDRNGDGGVSREEFRTFIKDIIAQLQDERQMMARACEVMFNACDIDQNGKISKEEFKHFMQRNDKVLPDETVDQLFVVVDKDGDKSCLTKDELMTVLLIGREALR